MNTITLHELKFQRLINHEEIVERIQTMARHAAKDYADETPVLLAVMDGVYHFASCFSLHFLDDAPINFVKASSYDGTKSKGVVQIIGLDNLSLTGKKILILEDIIESGLTIQALIDQIKSKNPKDIQLACLFRKQETIQYNLPITYVGFDIKKEFIIGFGMDYNGVGRCLKDVYQKVEE